MKRGTKKYRFGKEKQVSLEATVSRIPILQRIVISKRIVIIHANVSFLIGLDLLENTDYISLISEM